MINLKSNQLKKINEIREEIVCGDNLTVEKLKVISDQWSPYSKQIFPNEKDEFFDLVDSKGNPLGLKAERWLCHLFGLRHTCVHALIRWEAKNLGNIIILQVRSWSKSSAPGMLDISVGGHVTYGASIKETVLKEMYEEIGITFNDLVNNTVTSVGEYESLPEIDSTGYFLNIEWRKVFIADLKPNSFNKIKFNDNEVAGLYLCPEKEIYNLINSRKMPIADGLKCSLPLCINNQ